MHQLKDSPTAWHSLNKNEIVSVYRYYNYTGTFRKYSYMY